MLQPRRLQLVLLAGMLLAGNATAQVAGPAKSRGFALFEASRYWLEVNRVRCGLIAHGDVCTDAGPFDGIGGGFWPAGTPNSYNFNSGLQVAGIIGTDGGAWAGDTTGAFFFDPKGTTQHGEEVERIHAFAESTDATSWPEAARVTGGLYHPSFQGRASVSEGDAWWLMWDGNPALLAGRNHPLGVLVDVRALAWNYPSGNQDILYFVYTFHNVTSLNPADYAAAPSALRSTLLQKAQDLHSSVQATLGVTLPSAGYTITELFAAIATDPDVGDAGQNYASVNVPFALGFAWDHAFSVYPGWIFDPIIHSVPFFTGAGLTGIKLMGTPELSPGVPAGLSKFSTTTNGGGDLNDPANVLDLFRYLADVLQVESPCNFNPLTTHICFIRQSSAADIRHFQATGPLTLAPGQSASIGVAYVYAAPVRTSGSLVCPSCDIKPGSNNIIANLGDPSALAGGVNPIDSIAGFLGASDVSGDGVLQEQEFVTVPRSLYWKAQLAQAVFDHQFLLPSPPASPDFFLIPGDEKVTVMWRPSASEQTGDPFFTVARDAQVLNDAGVLVTNPLYDPNFRQFDVEGYRIYRARVDDPAALTLVAQFDYAGTVISDYAGQVNPSRFCAPELGLGVGVGQGCSFDPVAPGQPRVAHVDVPLAGRVEQIRFGDRIPLPDGTSIHLVTDTTPDLADTGVPFVYVDNAVRNNFRYFYAVTAFDLNSWQSGPSSFESPRVMKSVTPVRPSSNFSNAAVLTSIVHGRGVPRPDSILPVLDPATGRFDRPFPSTRDWTVTLDNLVRELVSDGQHSFAVRMDSLQLGSAYNGLPIVYWLTIATPSDTTTVQIPVVQWVDNTSYAFSRTFSALPVDQALASRYGSTGPFAFSATLAGSLAGNYYTSAFGRGCVNGAPGFDFSNTPQQGCDYNGARWFDGPSPTNNEVFAHPNGCSSQNFTGTNAVTCYANAGKLSGVVNIFEQKSYQTTQNVWRNVEGVLGGAVRGADYNVYWGAGGRVDSVIDVSNNVVIQFEASRVGASWGILNASASVPFGPGVNYDERSELTITDFGCVEPFRSFTAPVGQMGCPAASYTLSTIAVPGPIVHWSGVTTNARASCTAAVPIPPGCGLVAPNAGFAMYLPGHLFLFELAAGQLPPAGTVWSMRDYIGAIRGGGINCAACTAGADGPYAFSRGYPTYSEAAQPLAVGAELRVTVDVINRVNAPTGADLSHVHTVPDPYYLTNEFEADNPGQVIKFVNLPQDAVIRIYTSSGVLVNLLEHHSTTFGGAVDWNVRNRTGRRVSSGVYFYHVEAGNARRAGRFTVVNNRPGF
jgi:hypothetical protein